MYQLVYAMQGSRTKDLDKSPPRTKEKLNNTDTSQIVGYPEAPLAYDAVWALALALNKTSSQ
jgi:gamma-aminobutyric acid type B receptor